MPVMRALGLPGIVLFLLGVTSAAAAAEPRLVNGGSGVVREVADGRTLVLADGRVVRLAGIGAPVDGPPEAGFRDRQAAPSLESAAKEALERVAVGRAVELRFSGLPVDRYGRLYA